MPVIQIVEGKKGTFQCLHSGNNVFTFLYTILILNILTTHLFILSYEL